MREFMYEFHPDIPLKESEIFKIWGGWILSGSQDRVADHSKGEVDYSYLVWFYDHMPERSTRGATDYVSQN